MQTLNDFVDEVFVINLDRRTDRWQLISDELSKQQIQATRISAIDNKDNPVDACRLSHLSILEIARAKALNRICILEDDAEFNLEFDRRFPLIISALPTAWDVLYLGANVSEYEDIGGDLIKVHNALATHAYVVNANAYDALIRTATAGTPIDVAYSYIQAEIAAYAVKPALIRQRAGFSDIQGTHTDYTNLIV